MDPMICGLTGLNTDLMVDIMGRLDGPSVACVSCTCSNLRDAAQDRELWRRACHSVWPSTTLSGTDSLMPDFKRFYAESYPLVFYEKQPDRNKDAAGAQQNLAPQTVDHEFQDFISLVDVYYDKRCILSRASVPETAALTIACEDKTRRAGDSAINLHDTWFSKCPFRWEVLESLHSDTIETYADTDAEQDAEQRNLRTELEQDLRLSWVLLNKKTGKSVNLSSWEPTFSQRGWAFDGADYTAHFGCIIPAYRSLLPQGIVKCTIAVNCRLKDGDRVPELKEISLHMEDSTGKHLNGKESLIVLNQALLCPRSTNKIKVEEGITYYEKKKTEFMRKKQLKESIAIGLFASVQVTVFVALVCVFATRFT